MQTQLFIGGRFVPAANGETLASLNPHDNSVIADVAMAGHADVDRAVAAAKAAFPKWSNLAAMERGRLLLKLADAIEANADELARLESLDTGHPIRDTRNLDVPRTAATFRYFGGMADKFEGSVIPVEAGLPELHDARAGRHRRAGGAVEFPADVHELEDGAGACGRQLRGHEARRTHAAVEPRDCGTDGRSRLPGRRRQYSCRVWVMWPASTSPSIRRSARSPSPVRRPWAARSCRRRAAI